jgi:hypothetical protein
MVTSLPISRDFSSLSIATIKSEANIKVLTINADAALFYWVTWGEFHKAISALRLKFMLCPHLFTLI